MATINDNVVTVMHLAARNPHIKVLQFILDNVDADTDVRCTIGDLSPLHRAASNGNSAHCDLLLQRGTTVNIISRFSGDTTLTLAVSRHYQLIGSETLTSKTVEVLLDHEADAGSRTRSKSVFGQCRKK